MADDSGGIVLERLEILLSSRGSLRVFCLRYFPPWLGKRGISQHVRQRAADELVAALEKRLALPKSEISLLYSGLVNTLDTGDSFNNLDECILAVERAPFHRATSVEDYREKMRVFLLATVAELLLDFDGKHSPPADSWDGIRLS